MRIIRKKQLTLCRVVVTLLAGCAGQSVTYAGNITPIAGTCNGVARAVLIKRGQYVQFAPQQGVLILSGNAGQDGTVTAAVDTQGADRKPYHLAFHGTLSADLLSGEYVTPRCRYRANLRQSD